MPVNEVNKFSVKMVVSMIIAMQSLNVVGHLPINESCSLLMVCARKW